MDDFTFRLKTFAEPLTEQHLEMKVKVLTMCEGPVQKLSLNGLSFIHANVTSQVSLA